MKRQLMRGVTTVAVTALALVAPATPARASISGEIEFACTATLPVFPSVTGVGTCGGGTGPVPGRAVVEVQGVDTAGHPFVVTGVGDFDAAFVYSEPCPPLPLPVSPTIGTAVGTASITGLTAVHYGIPPTLVGAQITATFVWTRAGNSAVVVLTSLQISFTNGHSAVVASPLGNSVGGWATAAFAPLPGAGTCVAPAPTKAVVTGTANIPV